MGSKEPPKSAIRRGWCLAAVRCACAMVNAPPKSVWPGSEVTELIFSCIFDGRRQGIVPRCVFVIFGGSQRQAEGVILRRARNPVQSIGHRADEILHAIARGGGDGVKFQAALFAEIAQRFEARAI